jgi:hypothetical protein
MRMSAAEYVALKSKRQPRVKNAKRKEVNGLWFDSTREARRWQDLELMQRAGRISDLRRQVPFPITVNGKLITVYNADFCYLQDGNEVVEDAKGWRSEIYILKRKLVSAVYGFQIKET